jgi:ABC-2 type transport system permease protein
MTMLKTIRIALREYRAAVRTKGFIIGLVVAPIVMSGGFLGIKLFKDRVDTGDLTIAIIDHSGLATRAVIEAADKRNAEYILDERGERIMPAYIIEPVEAGDRDPAGLRAELSARVRSGDLHGFAEIDAGVLHPGDRTVDAGIRYHAENAAVDEARKWIENVINNHLRSLRLSAAGVTDSAHAEILSWVVAEGMGLVSVDSETGEVFEAERSSEARAIGMPFAIVMLMFIMMMMGAIPLISAVTEEKAQRIAEVVLGSVTPFQFMMGKVIGGVGVSATASVVYTAAGLIAMNHFGLASQVSAGLIAWFLTYMLVGTVMMGSFCAALGATCSEVNEAQSLTMPALAPVMIPMFLMVPLSLQPTSTFATTISLIPMFTPMVMMIRIASPATIPAWQPWAGLLGVILLATMAIWAGSRVFRIAILMQGKRPKMTDIVRWAVKG